MNEVTEVFTHTPFDQAHLLPPFNAEARDRTFLVLTNKRRAMMNPFNSWIFRLILLFSGIGAIDHLFTIINLDPNASSLGVTLGSTFQGIAVGGMLVGIACQVLRTWLFIGEHHGQRASTTLIYRGIRYEKTGVDTFECSTVRTESGTNPSAIRHDRELLETNAMSKNQDRELRLTSDRLCYRGTCVPAIPIQ